MKFVTHNDRILRHRAIQVKSTDTKWNWSFALQVKSSRGILLLGNKCTDIADIGHANQELSGISV